MKRKKILLGLTSLSAILGVSAIAYTSLADTEMPTNSSDLDKKVDIFDNLVSETIYASPSQTVEFDFEKEANEELQNEPTHKGTIDDPYDIFTAFNRVGAGDTLVLLNGTYKMSNRINAKNSGNAKRRIKVVPETEGEVHLDFSGMAFDSSNRGIQLNGSYWDFYGLDVFGAGDNGMYIAGSYNKVERCLFHENSDTGLQLGRSTSSYTTIDKWPSNNLILNCTSYNNYDKETLGENADGFAAKLTVGEGNVFDGCIAYRNADDGWDMFAKTDSGNIGTITLLNCVAFENGWVLNKTKSYSKDSNGNYIDSFMTENGDGNGFKLGGSSMEGDMVLKNCLAFNNRMGGFADNSNPGTLSLYNCTAYNNSVYVSMTSTGTQAIDPTGDTGHFGLNDNGSENFAMARTEGSYNTFYSCLSVVTNRDTSKSYENYDEYRGAASYSIFNTGLNKYTQITSPIDASSYQSKQSGSAYDGAIDDSVFVKTKIQKNGSDVEINGNTEIDTLLRNADGSINMGDTLALKSEELKTFVNGASIGATLNKTKSEDYEHVDWYDLSNVSTSSDYVSVLHALEALTIPCNTNYVYQDLDLVTAVNGLKVSWYSSDESVFKIGYYETKSVSGRNYLTGNVIRDRKEDKTIELVATISYNQTTLSKTFKLTIMSETPEIGSVLGVEDKYIYSQFGTWYTPEIIVTDKMSYAGNALEEGVDYKLNLTYQYALNTSSKYYDVDNVYTTVPGVYLVNYEITSLLGDGNHITGSYIVYVLSETAEIDISTDASLAETYSITQTNGYDFMVNASRDGAKVSAAFNSTYGYMYLLTSENEVESVETVVENGTCVDITDEFAYGVALNENKNGYFVHVVVSNRTKNEEKKIYSKVYTTRVTTEEIATCEAFYNLVSGKTSVSSNTIYLLTSDLDFSNTTYDFCTNTSSFTGLFNGQGHTIKNININSSTEKGSNIFYQLKGGTIMNVNFDSITIKGTASSDQASGIVGQMNGGYIHNVDLTNISVLAKASVGGLVGQVIGDINYITEVSLVNPMEKGYISGSKYIGGLVGNIQKGTEQSKVELYMSNCYVNAYIGDHSDSGYIGGIIGRNKNEFESYVMSVDHCYFTGTVDTNYTYSGGIVGSIDSTSGHIIVKYNVSDCTLVLKDTTLVKTSTTIGQKNNSPVIGRFTYVAELCSLGGNFGPYEEYHAEVGSNSDDFFNQIQTESFWTRIGFITSENSKWKLVVDEASEIKAPYCILA